MDGSSGHDPARRFTHVKFSRSSALLSRGIINSSASRPLYFFFLLFRPFLGFLFSLVDHLKIEVKIKKIKESHASIEQQSAPFGRGDTRFEFLFPRSRTVLSTISDRTIVHSRILCTRRVKYLIRLCFHSLISYFIVSRFNIFVFNVF